MCSRSCVTIILAASGGCGFHGALIDSATPPGDAGGDQVGLAAGASQTYLIRAGALYAAGANDAGQLGVGDEVLRFSPTRVVSTLAFGAVAAGDDFGCAIHAASSGIWCWGNDSSGQQGIGGLPPQLTPARVGLPLPAQLVTAGGAFACSVLADGSLWCWGNAADGEIGALLDAGASGVARLGDAVDWIAISAGDAHACGLRVPGALFCWGRNVEGEVGIGGGTPAVLQPSQVGADDDWRSLDCGGRTSCGVRADGSLWCWGDGSAGQLGSAPSSTPALVPLRVASNDDWTAVDVGGSSACGIHRDGSLSCWGDNSAGQLGLGDRTDRATPSAVPGATRWSRVSVGGTHTCAVDSAGAFWCAGANGAGALGLGDTVDRSSLTRLLSP